MDANLQNEPLSPQCSSAGPCTGHTNLYVCKDLLNFFIDIVHSSTSKPVFFALVGEGEDTLAGFGLAEDSGHAQVHPVVESQGTWSGKNLNVASDSLKSLLVELFVCVFSLLISLCISTIVYFVLP